MLMAASCCSRVQTVVEGNSCGKKVAAGEEGGICWCSGSDAGRGSSHKSLGPGTEVHKC